jgi:hypothetical protein
MEEFKAQMQTKNLTEEFIRIVQTQNSAQWFFAFSAKNYSTPSATAERSW